MEPLDNNGGADGDADADVWAGFERSAAYLRRLAALYQDSFAAPRKPVARVHVLEAQRQAREGLELLAGNLLNASSAVLARVEAQDAVVEALRERLEGVRAGIRDRQREADGMAARHFYGLVASNVGQSDGPKVDREPQEDTDEPHERG